MIGRLLLKDVYLHRRMVVLVLAGVVLGFALSFGGRALGAVGVSLLLQIFIALFFYLPISTIVEEQRDGTAVFVLSLPVRVEEYAIAKVLANVVLFAVPAVTVGSVSRWILGAGGEAQAAVQVLRTPWVPVVLCSLFVLFSAIVAVALLTGSMGWTVASTVVALFVGGNLVAQVLPRWERSRAWLEAVSAGGPTVFVLLLAEIGLASAVLLFAVRRMGRKGQYVG